MEVLFSAVVVVIIGLATLGLLDASSKTAARSEAKSVASSLAQQDQQRMRSMPITALQDLAETQTIPVNEVDYNVNSQTDYINEGGAPPACGRADYVRLRSTVSAPAMNGTRPVRIESLLHAYDGLRGCMVVTVTDASDQPVVGLRVHIEAAPTSTTSFDARTDADGKALFGWIPASAYTVSFPDPDWVDVSGTSNPTLNANVKAGTTASYVKKLDRPARINATFATRVEVVGRPGVIFEKMGGSANRVSVEHASMPSGTRRTPAATEPTPLVSNVQVGPLFPFTSPYAIYSGSCASNKLPATMATALAGLTPPTFSTSVATLPNTTSSATVFEPALDVRVTTLQGSPSVRVAVTGARVFLASADTSCPDVRPVQVTDLDGRMPDPGQPYSTAGYVICVDRPTQNTRVQISGRVVNDQLNGRQVNVSFASADGQSRTGLCP